MSLKMGASFLCVLRISFLKITGKRQCGKGEVTWAPESTGLSLNSAL